MEKESKVEVKAVIVGRGEVMVVRKEKKVERKRSSNYGEKKIHLKCGGNPLMEGKSLPPRRAYSNLSASEFLNFGNF